MTTLYAPLVGMHFRPPAKQVLASLPSGCALSLVPEPENPYDAKAIRVEVLPAETIPLSQMEVLAQALEGTGHELHEIMSPGAEPLHLGYVGDSDGKVCRQANSPGNREVAELFSNLGAPWPATLAFAPDGNPLVRVEVRV